MKTIQENPKGLHKRYFIKKYKMVPNKNYSPTSKPSQLINNYDPLIPKLVNVDEWAEYFVLRLDEGGSDINHVKACRIGIHAYADSIESTIPQLAKDLRERYPLL